MHNGLRHSRRGDVRLELTIARSIVQAHGGTVVAVARPEGGLDVAVDLSRWSPG